MMKITFFVYFGVVLMFASFGLMLASVAILGHFLRMSSGVGPSNGSFVNAVVLLGEREGQMMRGSGPWIRPYR